MLKSVSLSGISGLHGANVSKSPAIISGTFQYIKGVVSDPLDLSLGFVFTTYLVKSFYDLSSEGWQYGKQVTWRFSEKYCVNQQKSVLKVFVVANFFKWVDWVGKSKLTGSNQYPFSKLSALADLLYIYTYSHECINNIVDSHQARKVIIHPLSNARSKKYYKAIETKELASYISNFSYLSFSVISLGLFLANTTLLAPVGASAIIIYFLFLAISRVAEGASEVSHLKNKNIHWFKLAA
jgi:hypothetical protein